MHTMVNYAQLDLVNIYMPFKFCQQLHGNKRFRQFILGPLLTAARGHMTSKMGEVFANWGEPEQAPHKWYSYVRIVYYVIWYVCRAKYMPSMARWT